MSDRTALAEALAAYEFVGPPTATPLREGLIHETYTVLDGEASYILQRMHPDFGAPVLANIERVTRRLRERGVRTLRLIPSRAGSRSTMTSDGGRWRLMTKLDGASRPACDSPELAAAAGALVAEFHSALNDFDERLEPLGFPFHDWDSHRSDLKDALRALPSHRLMKPVAELADELLSTPPEWDALGALPDRVVHGDLKFNNLLFVEDDGRYQGHALIDLDTVGRRPLFVELGDAWRSWCNRSAEDTASPEIDLDVFRASIEHYLGAIRFQLERAELRSLAFGIERISHELAIRFAADALRERHWTYDRSRYPGAGEHNLDRARAQWALCLAAREARGDLLAIIADAAATTS